MAKYTVTTAVYLYTEVEADSEQHAIEIAQDTDWATWNFDSQDDLEAFEIDEEENIDIDLDGGVSATNE
jgi:hypothetical protein